MATTLAVARPTTRDARRDHGSVGARCPCGRGPGPETALRAPRVQRGPRPPRARSRSAGELRTRARTPRAPTAHTAGRQSSLTMRARRDARPPRSRPSRSGRDGKAVNTAMGGQPRRLLGFVPLLGAGRSRAHDLATAIAVADEGPRRRTVDRSSGLWPNAQVSTSSPMSFEKKHRQPARIGRARRQDPGRSPARRKPSRQLLGAPTHR